MKYLIWFGYAVLALIAAAYLFGATGTDKTNAIVFLAAGVVIWLLQRVRNEVQMHFFRVQKSQERILEELASLKNDVFLLKNTK